MKTKIIAGIILLFALIAFVLYITNRTYTYKTLWYNLPGIYDKDIFESRIIEKSDHPVEWFISRQYNKIPVSEKLESTLENTKTTAFLIIHNDSILTEKYWDSTTDSTVSNSFSVAKSFVNALIGRAIMLGYINNIDQKVGDFLPQFKSGDKSKITLRHLLTMSSGLDWDEKYSSLWSPTTEAYYGTDIRKQILELSCKKAPGVYFEYKGCDTELLAMVLEQATGMTLSTFFQKELWQPLGATTDAYWSLDHKDGMEKAYCCIYSNARDFARLAELYIHQGNWNGVQLIDSSFVNNSITPSYLINPESGLKTDFYGYQWWIIPEYKGYKVFYMRGILGQYVIAIPAMNTVVVRLGHSRGEKIQMHYSETYAMIDEAISLYTNIK
jgi:CubicO group peptidase (beta-lactamase class C family)